jgi:hypothetical protein
VKEAKDFEAPPAELKPAKSGLEPAPAHLMYRGDGLIFFITSE